MVISSDTGYKCTLYTFVPFTTLNENGVKESAPSFLNYAVDDNPGYNYMAAALLAMQEFNSKSSSIVPEMALYHDCPVTFDDEKSRFFDSGSTGHQAAQTLFQAPNPCAIAGAFNDQPALELQTMATAAKLPQVVAQAYNIRVADYLEGPYTSSVFPSLIASVDVLTSYLDYTNRTDYISFVYDLTETNIQRRERIALEFDQKKINWNSFPYSQGLETREVIDALRRIKESGYRTVVVSMNTPLGEMQAIADAAEELGMNNRGGSSDYFWIWYGAIAPEFLDTQNDNIRQVMTGSVYFFAGNAGTESNFWETWKAQNSSFVDLLNSVSPIQDPSQPGFYVGNETYFQDFDPDAASDFSFDSIMSIGMGACLAYYNERGVLDEFIDRAVQYSNYIAEIAQNESQGIDESFLLTPLNPKDGNKSITITGETHSLFVPGVFFTGASGYVRFGIEQNTTYASRIGSDVPWSAINFFPPGRKSDESRDPRQTDVSDFYLSGQWYQNGFGFVWADGRTSPPDLLRTTPEQNYLSGGTYRLVSLKIMLCGDQILS
jgi:hypothetical protein